MKHLIHPVIIPEMLAEIALSKNNTDRDKEDQHVQLLVNRLMFHSRRDTRFRRKLVNSAETARDTILMYFDHWVKGGYLEKPQQHQQGIEGLINTIQEIYKSDPDQFEFTVSPYINDKGIRQELIYYYTGERLSPGKASSYYLTQILRAKFQQLTLF
jgi:hypothetical protein